MVVMVKLSLRIVSKEI
ncbi:hypothetical protein Goarm_017139 [Gossypium armourianum]|uniref:Uncharacterized protein n=1 Tax=Gossypium armourianum TaxID=34283 RepID=A0A7J9JED7_9ROSI|nr:hypothetical protein [Gossypium armourianum]MBA0832772.1 hypothetical protein [Gossypium armourianum]